MGLHTSAGKTAGMVCRPCQASGNQLEAAYRRQMTGEGPSYQERYKGTGAVQGVREVDRGLINDRSHEDTTWASGRGEMELENLDHRERTAEVLHGLPGQERPA